jgi:DNA-binding protein HU-beta
MNKSELIDHVATRADISKASAGRAVDAMLAGITHALEQGESVSLTGFGTFTMTHRSARNGRNPKTGAPIKIEASSVPKFRPGKALKASA